MGKTAFIGWSAAALAAAAAFATPAAHADHGRAAARTHESMQPAPVRQWVPGHWEQRHHGRVWVGGHWVVMQPSHRPGHVPRHHGVPQRGGRFDQDRDGVADRHDRDIDGDGVPNWRDRAPRHAHWR